MVLYIEYSEGTKTFKCVLDFQPNQKIRDMIFRLNQAYNIPLHSSVKKNGYYVSHQLFLANIFENNQKIYLEPKNTNLQGQSFLSIENKQKEPVQKKLFLNTAIPRPLKNGPQEKIDDKKLQSSSSQTSPEVENRLKKKFIRNRFQNTQELKQKRKIKNNKYEAKKVIVNYGEEEGELMQKNLNLKKQDQKQEIMRKFLEKQKQQKLREVAAQKQSVQQLLNKNKQLHLSIKNKNKQLAKQNKDIKQTQNKKNQYIQINPQLIINYRKEMGKSFFQGGQQIQYRIHGMDPNTFTPILLPWNKGKIKKIHATSLILHKVIDVETNRSQPEQIIEQFHLVNLKLNMRTLNQEQLESLNKLKGCEVKEQKQIEKKQYSIQDFVANQVNFYFSDKNYEKDEFIKKHISLNQQKLKLLLNFPKIKKVLREQQKLKEILINFIKNNEKCNFQLDQNADNLRKRI